MKKSPKSNLPFTPTFSLAGKALGALGWLTEAGIQPCGVCGAFSCNVLKTDHEENIAKSLIPLMHTKLTLNVPGGGGLLKNSLSWLGMKALPGGISFITGAPNCKKMVLKWPSVRISWKKRRTYRVVIHEILIDHRISGVGEKRSWRRHSFDWNSSNRSWE